MTIEELIANTAKEIVAITEQNNYSTLITEAKQASLSMINFITFSTKIAEIEEASAELTNNLVLINNTLMFNNNDLIEKLLKIFYLNILNSTKQ